MRFIRATADTGRAALAVLLLNNLREGARVLWLVPGGSNIPIAVQVMALIPPDLRTKLTIMLGDERYGPVGHAASNFKQLLDAGFDPKGAHVVSVLGNASLEATVNDFGKHFQEQRNMNQIVVGQFGIGADGHIAGILPHTPAAQSDELAVGYTGSDFTRITLTFAALKQVDAAFAFVYSDSKRTALEHLRDDTAPLADQPCQILKSIPEAYVYNDQIDEEGASA